MSIPVGAAFVCRRQSLKAYTDDDRNGDESQLSLVVGDVLIYIGRGKHLSGIFLSPYGIVGWNVNRGRSGIHMKDMMLRDWNRMDI